MLRESLLNSLFTSSIPPTSLTVRVTLLFFSRLSCRFHVCPPSFSLLFFFLTHDCTPAYLSVLLKCRVSTSSVKDERKVCEHACAKLCMSNRLICPKEPRVSRDALSPSLQHSPLQMRLSLLIYFQQKKNGGSLFFWYTVLLKSPSFKKKKKTPWPGSHKKTGQWHAARPRYSLVVEYKQQEVWCDAVWYSTRWILIPQHLGYETCVCLGTEETCAEGF